MWSRARALPVFRAPTPVPTRPGSSIGAFCFFGVRQPSCLFSDAFRVSVYPNFSVIEGITNEGKAASSRRTPQGPALLCALWGKSFFYRLLDFSILRLLNPYFQDPNQC